ncbi:MAG TPA: hypothetical protein ENJ35_00755, partial [Gammaproteobacteria bacterium]|nr:hypothetical protein [Gammaproteobacteria bacterium]
MTRTFPLSLAVAAAITIPVSASAIQLTDYLNPESHWEEAFVLGQFNTKSGNQDQTSYNLNLDANYLNNYSSLPRVWKIELDGNSNISRGPNKGDESINASQANANATVDNYFNNKEKYFWYGSVNLGYQDDKDDIYTKVGGGVGYGRVINATPLAKVLRFEEELREHGIITGKISETTYLALARIVDKELEFKARYGDQEYKAYWFIAMEELLRLEGVLKGGKLGAAGTLYMDRVMFDEPISIRKHGWLVRGGVGLVVQDFNGNKGDPSLDIEWEYAKPHGYRGQFINLLRFSTILADNTGQIITNNMSYSYELSDRIDWVNRWKLLYEKAGDSSSNDTLTNNLSSTFRYYITNIISVDATVALNDIEDDID